jgi:Dolichyl-phosphate-mannose-protein mannosyltransferase
LPEAGLQNIVTATGQSSNAECARTAARSWLAGLLVTLFWTLVASLWFSFDRRYPSMDEAGHIMASIDFQQALLKVRPFNLHWWNHLLTLSPFYPPTVYFLGGVLMSIFGTARWVSAALSVLFTSILTGSVFAITRLLNGRVLTALAAACIVNCYPVVASLNHSYFLDFPVLAMVALGLASLLWWHRSPAWYKAIICGVILAAACLSKQIGVAYLVPTGIIILLNCWSRSDERRVRLSQLVALVAIVLLIGVPYLVANFSLEKGMTQYNLAAYHSKNIDPNFLDNAVLYFRLLPDMMSPLLMGLFILAIIFLKGNTHKQLSPLTASFVGGCLCAFSWRALSDPRYLEPGLVAPAVLTAFLLERLPNRMQIPLGLRSISVGNLLAIVLGCLIAIQYLAFNFYPYPISSPAWLAVLRPKQATGSVGVTIANPTPALATDWGMELVLKKIAEIDGSKSVYLNVTSNSNQLNAHSFVLCCREHGSSVTPTSCRTWTIMGDKVNFSPQTAAYCQWYLVKTGDSGLVFYDRKSADNYAALCHFLADSGTFALVMRKTLPDGSELLLYRKK